MHWCLLHLWPPHFLQRARAPREEAENVWNPLLSLTPKPQPEGPAPIPAVWRTRAIPGSQAYLQREIGGEHSTTALLGGWSALGVRVPGHELVGVDALIDQQLLDVQA